MQEMRNTSGMDAGSMLNRVGRLFQLDTSVFDEVKDDPAQTLPAIVMVVVATLLAALGGWLWLIIEFDGLSTGRIIVRELVLGSLFAIGLWVAWVALVKVLLEGLFSVNVGLMPLVRTMGLAAAPGALALAMLIPVLSFGLALAALVAWFALSSYAVQSAAPDATPKQAVVANLGGFLVFALVLAILADIAGMAPGVFVHGADIFSGDYVSGGGFDVGDFDAAIEEALGG